jgi:hypothetical protein
MAGNSLDVVSSRLICIAVNTNSMDVVKWAALHLVRANDLVELINVRPEPFSTALLPLTDDDILGTCSIYISI